ncbi:malate dehydrogenase [Salpingoeca rosetta]|uniref:Malic enzyme n=1 Tax=Salpingoeca rosetta (strain ATCC 50818 / BSB-021) TaxID=946362 RepID=F2TZL0_SALR5|nr:malate dehydrogenase [Salpingoeca rosetta]EGD79034.1 malate dehydrogenase [Salpingoeca rosetta]|eukprot:XP_004997990.1 malate dehydrogenase [Salpingoeca rosetta]
MGSGFCSMTRTAKQPAKEEAQPEQPPPPNDQNATQPPPAQTPQTATMSSSKGDIYQDSLEYHAKPTPGKLATFITKSTSSVRDLSLAYSPGVAEPVRQIAKDKENAYVYTGKGNTVAVISNGTAILGLGNLGALASKPVMEGKCLLFKTFADIDAVDIEVDTKDVDTLVNVAAAIGETWGGINLEDIKAPECFEVERRLKERLSIPVFHDDQHGTAIVTAAGLLNALEVQGKELKTARIVCVGAGAAGIACMRLIRTLGATNVLLIDSRGVIYKGRENVNEYKAEFATEGKERTLDDAIDGADVFIGVSGPGILTADHLKKMADKPIVFACSNPEPEIQPELALKTRPDVILATGRSDYPNQVNNVLCFPFIFRGALDARASAINDAMKVAAVEAIRGLAKEECPKDICELYKADLKFGAQYILPKPMDKRLKPVVSEAVRKAAVSSGVARAKL